MDESQAKVGVRVRTLVNFSGVPKGTEGVIDEDYGTGVMVAWDMPDRYPTKPLRDGFNKSDELHFLTVVINAS